MLKRRQNNRGEMTLKRVKPVLGEGLKQGMEL
jgi:hypothetical protein